MLKRVIKRIALAFLGIVIIGHALIHLGLIPGGIKGPDGTTGWSGHSWLLDHILNTSGAWSVVIVIEAGTIVFFVAGGLGLLGIPFLKSYWKTTTIIASILSLLLFAITWNGLLPQPSEARLGPIISGILLIGILLWMLFKRAILQARVHHTLSNV